MTFQAGTRIGAYEILGPLGAGGMGEVWHARDTRLSRDVALKMLPDSFSDDAARLARFRREAQLLASLNHPNIAAIHGLEETDGKPFLALELVPGEDLAARLQRGPVPLPEAMEIARQIVEALEEAHAKGIVHRDLKPGNIKLTPDGKVKVLDFGLAKAYAGDRTDGTAPVDVSGSTALARSETMEGVILGTAAYVSPEQASGKALDRRTDIWSFGVVLFEMLTGRRLFRGDTTSEVLASVIKDEPPWDRLPEECPPAILRLLRRCLRKAPRERLQDIGDARIELEAASEEQASGAAGSGGGRGRTAWREKWAWAIAVAAMALAAFFAMKAIRKKPDTPTPLRFALDMPEGIALDPNAVNHPAVSPDGLAIAFGRPSLAGASHPLCVRSLVTGETRALEGTDGAYNPFWSPDGGSVVYFDRGRAALYRVDLNGGPPRRLGALPGTPGTGSWSSGGTIVFNAGGFVGRTFTARIYTVSASGGEPVPLTAHDAKRGEDAHFWPHFLPDGQRFLFSVRSDRPETTGVFVASLKAPDERRRLLPEPSKAVPTADRLLFTRERTLLGQVFDPSRLSLNGDAVPIAQNVGVASFNTDWGMFGASGGTLVYVGAPARAGMQLAWVDRRGTKIEEVGRPALYGQLVLAADGKQAAVEIASGTSQDLWVLDMARGVGRRVTTDPIPESDPLLAPDGKSLVFGVRRDGGGGKLLRLSLEGVGEQSLLLESAQEVYPESWSPDGKTLLYMTEDQRRPRSLGSVWALGTGPQAKPELVFKNGFGVDEPQVSPDGRWLAYISDESDQWEVYVRPFGRPGEPVRVSVNGGGQPKWRRDGKELFYLAADGRLMSVRVTGTGAAFDVGLPAALFDTGGYQPELDDYAPSADGQRFLVKVAPEGRSAEMNVVFNWPSLITSSAR